MTEITPESIDQLQEEVGNILTMVKSWHFEKGREFGHLAIIIDEEEYQDVIGDDTWTYDAPQENPSEYDPAAVTAPAGERHQLEAEWTRKEDNNAVFNGACAGARELIIYGAGEDAVIPLKRKFTNYATVTPYEMIEHLRKKSCIKMTMLEKHIYRQQGYEQPWDTTQNIAVYFQYLETFTDKLQKRGISTTEEDMVVAAVARFWESEFFPKEKMIEWEKRDDEDQDWGAVRAYFSELWHNESQYSKATAKKARHNESANAVAVKEEKSEDAESDAAMMFAMMQEQHRDQLNAMKESTDAAMLSQQQTMLEMAAQIKDLCCQIKDQSSSSAAEVKKSLAAAAATGGGGGAGKGKRRATYHKEAQLCPHCNKVVKHKAEDCFELEANKDRRPANWKPANK